MNAETKAPAAVRQMIEAAGIKRIVCVDDSYAVTDVDALLPQLSSFSSEERATLIQDDLGPEGVWEQQVRQKWKDMNSEEQASLVDDIAALEHGLEPVPTGFAEIVNDACDDIEFLNLSLAGWRQKKKEIVEGIPEIPTLILFDQDFRNEGGADDEGQKLIAELEKDVKGHESVQLETFYGILTNTVSVEQEHSKRTQIVHDTNVDPSRFVLISKQILQGGANLLPERLRPILLAPLFARLMEEVGKAVAAAQMEARKRAVGIPPEDLEQMVLKSSNQEGVWPPDTLLRILETMQREAVRKSLREENDLLGIAERVEAVAKVVLPDLVTAGQKGKTEGGPVESGPVEKNPVERVPYAAEISSEENYERAEHLNSLHLPIDLGDLFKNTETGEVYVLIAQPCNLMVRDRGKRAYEPSHMLLAKVIEGSTADKTQFKLFELPYFNKETGESHFVRLNGPKIARTLVLDACVLNADGQSRLNLRSDEPAALLPYWKKRRTRLHKVASELLQGLKELSDEIGPETRDALGGSFEGDPFPLTDFSPSDELIAWGCERIGRVRDPYARALLSRFSQYFARDAYLHNLARQ